MKYSENDYRFGRPPAAVRRAQPDNIALVPASLLPFKEQWQQVANRLPAGTTLLVLPAAPSRSRTTLESLATALRSSGHRVTFLPAQYFVSDGRSTLGRSRCP